MAKYVTMTVGGAYGATFEADNDDAAEAEAERRGYVVQDIVDSDADDDVVIVVVES